MLYLHVISIFLSLSISLSIYLYIYNRHLGLINAPPYLCFSSKRPFSLLIYYQKGQTYTQFWPRPY